MRTHPLQTRLVLLCLMAMFAGDHQVSGGKCLFCPSCFCYKRRDRLSTEGVTLGMAKNSFDDQYLGCENEMEGKVQELNDKEMRSNIYAEAWRTGEAEWNSRKLSVSVPRGFKPEYAIALVTYTGDIYKQFSPAVRTAGSSRKEYFRNFNFKALHFLLTRALQLLQASNNKCYNVYRGARGTFNAKVNKHVRFGQFASSSLEKSAAESFALPGDKKSIFTIKTCLGAFIGKFSQYPGEEEVLIPPYERFKVVSSKKEGETTFIELCSDGKYSQYNCEYVKGYHHAFFPEGELYI